ncbi:MAG: hypothetical protein COA79_17010 [Planctomycetota bacterium]|nr:MAG: hypothetical protein COA79_17010 [Planctomycetota bacterium]
MKLYLVMMICLFFIGHILFGEDVLVNGTKTVLPKTVKEGAVLVEIFSSKSFFEAPVWDVKHQQLYFTGYKDKYDRVKKFIKVGDASDVENTKGVGGTFLGINGNLLAVNCIIPEVLSYELTPEGPVKKKVLASDKNWLNPNDLCQLKNGSIYFTDPDFKQKKRSAVYHLSKKGVVAKVISTMSIPNGIIASRDGKTLYVSDSHLKEWKSFLIMEDGKLKNEKVFFKPKTKSKRSPDGMTIDAKGNLYFTGLGGLWVVTPLGKAIGFIKVPEFCSNVAFGGKDFNELTITCGKKVYRLSMNVKGNR